MMVTSSIGPGRVTVFLSEATSSCKSRGASGLSHQPIVFTERSRTGIVHLPAWISHCEPPTPPCPSQVSAVPFLSASSFERLTGKEDFEPFEESFAHRDIIGNWGNAGNSFNREYGAPPISSYDPQYGFTDAKTKTF